MCIYRTQPNSSKYMKSSIYHFHTITYLPNAKLTTGKQESHMMKQWQLHHRSPVNSLTPCKWTVLQNKCTIPPLTNLPSCIKALYTYKDQAIGEQCLLSISKVSHTFIPIAVTSNLWIIPSSSETLGSTITIICLDKAKSIVPLQQHYPLPAVLHAYTFTYPHVMRITPWHRDYWYNFHCMHRCLLL